MLKQDPHVAACVMFGRERFQTGVIIEPKPQYQFDPSDEMKLANFRNMIWYGFAVHSHWVLIYIFVLQAYREEDQRVRSAAFETLQRGKQPLFSAMDLKWRILH